MEQESVYVLKLSPEETEKLCRGVNLIRRAENESFVVFKDDIEYKACRNKCKHQGGTFVKDIEDVDSSVLRCTKHGWKLDCSNMRYVNPPDSFKQEELVPEICEDGSLSLLELRPPQPWQQDARDPQPVAPGEVILTYFTHACVEMKFGEVRMFTDPWLTGPSFARGWWLLHEPPPNWLDRLATADLIYISHLHSDHLSYPTLELLEKRNPNIPIFVGNTSTPVFSKMKHHKVKMNNINILKFGVWKEINEDLRFMILMDGVHPEMDTCIIIDYKGHLILNTVDCTNPNGGKLPENVDVMLSDFAGGASGFPMTFTGGKYTEEWKANFIKRERTKLLYYKTQIVRQVNPKVYCPFAGYFVEAHPSDWYIKATNTKNDAKALNELITKFSPGIRTWTPVPSSSLDLGKIVRNPGDRAAIKAPPEGTKIFKDSWDFDRYISRINAHVTNEIFAFPEWIEFYYRWTGFKNYNLVLRMIETDDNFEPIECGYDYLVDFSGEIPTFPDARPARQHNYLEVENRIGVHRQTVVCGMLWDDLYIGFNNRISRTPDTFHYLFWNHMQILLPLEPPDWDAFLNAQKAKKMNQRSVWKPKNLSEVAGKPNYKTNAPDEDKFYIVATAAVPIVLGIATIALIGFTRSVFNK
ncbi:cytidine monophosphate-N-acetylneuraminic acid hydroxylase-like isoform X1 [Ptychodera flava]|uniref:cytidine monophosphate-N-acetylneuraminic acid hydroxylase-like isoform X1 n=2 Tax=Ptychodera flava TaxID=63121 RepID=UPI00396AA114